MRDRIKPFLQEYSNLSAEAEKALWLDHQDLTIDISGDYALTEVGQFYLTFHKSAPMAHKPKKTNTKGAGLVLLPRYIFFILKNY